MTRIKAALIDMDGTLYNSMPNHVASWHRLMTEQGIPCTPDEFYLYEGMTGSMTISRLWQRAFGFTPDPDFIADLYHRKTLYFNDLPRAEIMPGAPRFLDTLLAAGITPVLVTGSGQPSVLQRLDQDFPGVFPASRRVTARNVTHGKPHPEPYLLAMQLAGVTPAESIVIENAPIGVTAGHASGAFTIGLTTGPVPRETLRQAGANLVLPSMHSLATLFNPILKYIESL